MQLKYRFLILPIVLIFLGTFVPSYIYAGGAKEDLMPKAEKLIEAGQYNDAMLILADIMRNSPEQFTEAEKLVRKIRTAREKYNTLYEELARVLDPPKGEAIDEERAYELIRAMEDLDKTPNKATVEAFAQARDTIVFAVTNKQFQDIMDQCTELLKEQKYLEAIDKYLSGFVLHREFFVKKGYGNIVLNQIDSDIAGIKSFVDQFKSLTSLLKDQSALISKAAGDEQPDSLEQSISEYRDLLLETLNLKRNIVNKTLALDAIRVSIQKEEESDIPYISTLRVLSKGRLASDSPEGIAGAIELYWEDVITRGINEIEPHLAGSYKKALELYDGGLFSDSQKEFLAVRRYGNILLTLLNMWGGIVDFDEKGANPDSKGWKIVKTWLPRILYVEETINGVPFFIDLADRKVLKGSYAAEVENSDDYKAIEQRRKDLLALRASVAADEKESDNRINRIKKIALNGIDTRLSDGVDNTLKKYQNDFYLETYAVETQFAEKIVKLQVNPLEKDVAERKNDLDTSSRLIAGTDTVINGIKTLVKRPDVALETLNKARKILEKDDSELERILALMDKYNKTVRDSDSLKTQKSRIESIREDIQTLSSDIASALEKAKDLNDEADNLYNLASLRLDEAYSLYNRGKYDGARSKYYEAESTFIKSLNYREDENVRRLLTGEMPKLFEEIMTALNKQIIREVRQYINQGKDYYNVEKFIKAEQLFKQARERYKVTHDEPNVEVENWLVKVKKALEATSGRVIVPTDPLYPEMIHILNLAEEDFSTGRKLFEMGKKDEADERFSEAVKNIEYVKETFPRNFKASVLYLKILEYTEKDTFDSYFASMFESAVAKIKTDPNSADDDLLALAEVKPDYPGLKRALYKSGIAAGRLTPPPAKVDIAKARSLYLRAKRIADGDNRAQFPIAIAYLEEALSIDSNYNSAAVLLDQLRTSTGGVSSFVMNQSDLQQLRYAENLYVDGKYLEASIIVNKLWSNVNNRKSSKLNDLKKKVEARL